MKRLLFLLLFPVSLFAASPIGGPISGGKTGLSSNEVYNIVVAYAGSPTNGISRAVATNVVTDNAILKLNGTGTNVVLTGIKNTETTAAVIYADDAGEYGEVLTGKGIKFDADTISAYGDGSDLTNLTHAPVVIAGTAVTVTTNTVAGTGQKTYTIASTAGNTINLIAGSNVTITTNTPNATWTIASTGGGSGSNGISYANVAWPAVRTIGNDVVQLLWTNGNVAVAITNSTGALQLRADNGENFFTAIKGGSTRIYSEGETELYDSAGLLGFRATLNGRQVFNNAGVTATAELGVYNQPVFGDYTWREDLFVDGEFLYVRGTSIRSTSSLLLSQIDVLNAYLTNTFMVNAVI